MSPATPTPLPADTMAETGAMPAWAYRSEAFPEDFDERTLPGLPSPRLIPAPPVRRHAVWPWAFGVPVFVLAIGLVAVYSGG